MVTHETRIREVPGSNPRGRPTWLGSSPYFTTNGNLMFLSRPEAIVVNEMVNYFRTGPTDDSGI